MAYRICISALSALMAWPALAGDHEAWPRRQAINEILSHEYATVKRYAVGTTDAQLQVLANRALFALADAESLGMKISANLGTIARPDVAPSLTSISASFPKSSERAWRNLRSLYDASVTECNQRSSISASDLLRAKKEHIYCYLRSNLDNIDALRFLENVRQVDHPLAKDRVLSAYHLLQYLRAENYPEALRILVQDIENRAGNKLLYNMVQRIFSLHQKGSGKVVLRQNL